MFVVGDRIPDRQMLHSPHNEFLQVSAIDRQVLGVARILNQQMLHNDGLNPNVCGWRQQCCIHSTSNSFRRHSRYVQCERRCVTTEMGEQISHFFTHCLGLVCCSKGPM